MVDTNTGGSPYIEQAYALGGPEEARELYDEWAERYDADLATPEQDYVGHEHAASTVARVAGVTGHILDAGCGTGLVGRELVRWGGERIDGVDLSPGMLERARSTGAYGTLAEADLTAPLAMSDDTYDVVVCVGTLTHGHVGPEALAEFVRVTRPGGFVVATVLADIWSSGGYRAEVDRLVEAGAARLVEADVVPYRAGAAVDARMLVLAV